MATHSSHLPWEIPWTEETGELQSMASQSDRIERTGRHKHRKLGDEWFAEKTKNGQGTSEGDRLQF